MKNLRGKAAAVTGAASGIGKALALQLANEGCRVAVSDVREDALEETAKLVSARGARVDAARVDVSDRRAVHAWADRLVEEFGPIHLVFNNAGVTASTSVESLSYDDLAWVMGVNFWGVVHGTMAFLPHLQAAGEGWIVNMSSVVGLVALATQAPYSASKFAVRGFTEALRQELEIEGSPVRVVSVHPGGVRTDLVRSGRVGRDVLGLDRDRVVGGFDRLARTSPERAARRVVRGIKNDKKRILIGFDARLLDLAQRLFPVASQRLIVRRARAARSRR